MKIVLRLLLAAVAAGLFGAGVASAAKAQCTRVIENGFPTNGNSVVWVAPCVISPAGGSAGSSIVGGLPMQTDLGVMGPFGILDAPITKPYHQALFSYVNGTFEINLSALGGATTQANIPINIDGAQYYFPELPQPVINGNCLIGSGGMAIWGSCSGSGTAVSSVTGTAGQIVAAPTTGAVVLSLPATITQATTFSAGLTSTTLSLSGNLTTNVMGSTQCLQANSSGIVSGTGAACGSELSGMVAGQVPIAASASTITSSHALTGTGLKIASSTGTLTNNDCVKINAAGDLIDAGAPCGSGGGGGTVTSVGLTVPASSLFSVTGSPITGSGVFTLTTAGTSGGIPYFSSSSQLNSSGVLASNQPVIGGGAGIAPSTGTASGNTTKFGTVAGALFSGDCIAADSSGNLTDAGAACGGQSVIFTGSFSGSANTYAIPSPAPASFTLTDQYIVQAKVNVTNTGASTLNVAATGAVAIDKQTIGGLVALSGGELLASNQYDFVYQSACTCFVMTTVLASTVDYAATSATVTAAQWANGELFTVTASGQTLTLPSSTTLSPNGGIIITTTNNSVTLAPNGGDGINGGTVGSSVTIPANTTTIVTTNSTPGVNAISAPIPSSFALNITVGSTGILGGTTTRVLYDNAGVLGEYVTTGTGNAVLGTGPTLVTPTITGSFTATGLVTNADLVNNATTVNGQTCTLGSTCTISAAATSLTVGTTTISSGTNGDIEYNNSGVLGEKGTTGSGSVVLATAPSVSSLTVTTAFTATGLVTNADLANSTVTVNGTTCTLGSSCSPVATAVLTTGSGTGHTFTAPSGYFVCTSTCTVTPPVPAAGYEFCVMNDDNTSTVITLGALGSSAFYENTARTAYGTAGTGTLTSGGAAADMVCIVGRDSTHYLTTTYVGTWTAS